MPKLPLTFACGLYDRMLALYTGDVVIEGVDLNFLVEDDPRRIFDRMAARQEFDVCEFSSSEYISRFSAGQCPFVALPVFASRVFRHGFIYINKKHIRSPKDLEGKRIGVPLYTMTAAVWQRGHLMDDYGVDFSGADAGACPLRHHRPRLRPARAGCARAARPGACGCSHACHGAAQRDLERTHRRLLVDHSLWAGTKRRVLRQRPQPQRRAALPLP